MDGINFNNMPCVYWDDATKISHLQRRVLIYSIMYYELDNSCVSDKQFDAISRQLVNMQGSVDDGVLVRTKYYYVFQGFDGSTGFDLPGKLTPEDLEYLTEQAEILSAWRA